MLEHVHYYVIPIYAVVMQGHSLIIHVDYPIVKT